jgi:quercetin dioxygenase-like cupin family protein
MIAALIPVLPNQSVRAEMNHTAASIAKSQPFVRLVLFLLAAAPAGGQERQGVIPHPALLKMLLPDTANLEVAVYETEYAPGGVNPRHLHPAAITFYVVSGTGVWQEDGKPPVTLKAGDSLFVPAGTIHSHWNPSASERLRFLEFIVAEKDNGRSIPQPVK